MPTPVSRYVVLGAAALGIGLVLSGALRRGTGLRASSGAGIDTVFAEDFESGTLAAWTDGVDPTRHRIITDSSQAQSGRRFLQVTYRSGGDGGWLTHFFLPGYDSLYVSYYVRLPESWQGGTKLIALYGSRTDDQWSGMGKAGTCPTGTDFFATMLIAEVTGDPGPTRFYSYFPAMTREPDGVTCWGRFGDGSEQYLPPLTLSHGRWHHVEFWVKLNTPGHVNASQSFWLDDILRGTWSGLNFRNSAKLRLNAVQLTFNRGIAGGPTTQTLDVDHLVITTRNPTRTSDHSGCDAGHVRSCSAFCHVLLVQQTALLRDAHHRCYRATVQKEGGRPERSQPLTVSNSCLTVGRSYQRPQAR